MSLDLFTVVAENPNHVTGGGGCLCSETSCGDGPYVVFHASETSSNISPHPVLCGSCMWGLVDKFEDGEVLGEEGAEVAA